MEADEGGEDEEDYARLSELIALAEADLLDKTSKWRKMRSCLRPQMKQRLITSSERQMRPM